MTENNTQHAPVRAAAPTTLTAEEIKAQLTESGIPEHLHPYFPRGLGVRAGRPPAPGGVIGLMR